MKTPPPRARLFCRIVRHWSSEESAHVAACGDCQQFFAASRALESGLRRDASRLAVEPDAGFEQRLLNAVRRAEAAPAREEVSRRGSGGLWLAGAALAAVACGVFVAQWDAGKRSQAEVASGATAADAAVIIDAVQSLSDRLVETVIPSAGAMVADNPLQRELDSLQTDARSALRFLAMNFLPAAPAAAAQPRSG